MRMRCDDARIRCMHARHPTARGGVDAATPVACTPRRSLPSTPLRAGPTAKQPAYLYQEYFPTYPAEEDLAKVQAARVRLAEEMRALEVRLLMRQQEVARTREELRSLGVV